MKQKKILIATTLTILIAIIAIHEYLKDPLIGRWQSNKGDGFGLIEKKGAPFIIEFEKNFFKFQQKRFKILEQTKNEDGRIFIKTKNFTLKLKILEKGKIIFNFPDIGIRSYKKMNFY